MKLFNLTGISFISLLGIALSTPLSAQILEEIIVTAQKREQNMQDVGISVTAYSGEQMRELGVLDTVDLTTMTPGLQYTVPNAEGSQINFFLRGVGLNEVSDFNENPVAVYFDGVYRASIGGLHLQNFDMERAEVLRGPQGTLFGRNTSGGLIHFISKKPVEEFEAYAEIGAGSFDEIRSEAMINGALSDNLFARLSFASNHNTGYVENDFAGVDPITGNHPGDFNETNAKAGRLQLLWQASDKVEVLLKGHYSHNRGQVGGWQNQVTQFDPTNPDNNITVGPAEINNACAVPTGPGLDCQGFRDTDGDPHRGSFDRDGDVGVSAYGISAQIDWELDNGMTVTSITAWDKVDRTQEEDTDASPILFVLPSFYAEPEQFTQELRIAGETENMRWQAGFYYFDWDSQANYRLTLAPSIFEINVDVTQETEAWSLFGQAEYDLTDQVTLIGGLRFSDESKEIDYLAQDLGIVVAGVMLDFDTSTVGDLARHDKTNMTGMLELDWKPNEDLLLYAKYSRGVKSAGFNAQFLDQTGVFAFNANNTIPFDDETLTSYEIGFKSTLFEGTTRLNASAFYYDYKDFQTFRFDQFSTFIFNTDSEVYGAEIEIQTSPAEGWDIILGASFLDATAEDIPGVATTIPSDRNMVAAPDVTLNGMARYQWAALNGTMAIIASFNWQDETFYDIQNYDISQADSYIVGNLRGKWTSDDNKWTVEAFVNNIADEEYVTYTFDFTGVGGFNQLHFGKPRWFGGSVRYTWQ